MKLAVVFFLISSAMSVKASSKWMWHGAFPWVYSHAEGSWWYMKAGSSSPLSGWMWHGAFPWVYSHNESAWRYMKSTSTDGKFFAWKQSEKKWYSFNEVRNAWDVLPGQNKAGDTYTIPDLSLEMIWVEPGTFMMGSPDDEEGRSTNETQHEVTLTKGYWLGKYEVTQTQWEKVMNYNPSHFKGVDRPVEGLYWTEIEVFCKRLNYRESEAGRLPTGMAYHLPTEAQWEYACRAGTTTAYYWGAAIDSSNANYAIGQTFDIGQYAANPWGFFDMHGNVWEWCADLHERIYPSFAVSDPVGPAERQYDMGEGSHRTGTFAVVRGGRSANRNQTLTGIRKYNPRNHDKKKFVGFRLSLQDQERWQHWLSVNMESRGLGSMLPWLH
jgi:formylglycine-generating enzyme required for sulfatase activity